MTETFVDQAPIPPPDTIKMKIEALAIGDSLCAPASTRESLAAAASRIRRERRESGLSEMVFKTKWTPEGPRVWRVA